MTKLTPRNSQSGKVSDGFIITLGLAMLVLLLGLFLVSGNIPLWYPFVLVGVVGGGFFIAKALHSITAQSDFVSFLFKGKWGTWIAVILLLFSFLGGTLYLSLLSPWISKVLYPTVLVCRVIPTSFVGIIGICGLLARMLSPIVFGIVVNASVYLFRKNILGNQIKNLTDNRL